MSAIAYITDSKMLELHRLNAHTTMNFWRPSANLNFSDFKEGDLVFFLSKDKEHKNRNEKGVVGFGEVASFNVASVNTMWKRYGVLNGYNTPEEFKEAVIRFSKDHQLPTRISSFYLINVTFFRPVYLSECGMKISSQVESYIYLKPDEVIINLLQLAKQSLDPWSALPGSSEAIEKAAILYSLNTVHKHIGDISSDEQEYKRSSRFMKRYQKENPDFHFVRASQNELCRYEDRTLTIVLYNEKQLDDRLVLGQVALYRHELPRYSLVDIRFVILNDENNLQAIIDPETR